MQKRIMVDMSATLLHHGHIRLLKKASKLGEVIVGLTKDNEIKQKKFYKPELSFNHRKEILESIKYVSKVVPTPWLIDEKTLELHKIDLLVHGDDDTNLIKKERLKVFERTKNVSSSILRKKSIKSITSINNQKLMLTPGPATILHQNILDLKPVFGRGDEYYDYMSKSVISWIKKLSGQDTVIMCQGSSTFALELAAHSFIEGEVLLISTGYYSDRLKKLLPKNCHLTICSYEELTKIEKNYDWVMCAYTETSIAFKLNLQEVKNLADKCGARLYVDATGSIGLEENHELADVMAFSSCKGLFGLTGGCFIAHKDNIKPKESGLFYFSLETHRQKKVTGPYHAIASLFGVINSHNKLKERVKKSKQMILENWGSFTRKKNQPLLCTYLEGKVIPNDNSVVLYSPRSSLSGSVICHLGEIHQKEVKLLERISIKKL